MGVVEYSEITALIFSVSLLVSKFNFNVSWKLRKLLVDKLSNDFEIDKKADIPTLCFSLTSFIEKELDSKEYYIIIVIIYFFDFIFFNFFIFHF